MVESIQMTTSFWLLFSDCLCLEKSDWRASAPLSNGNQTNGGQKHQKLYIAG